jgi:guanine deaminase
MNDRGFLQRAVDLAARSPEPIGCAVVITSKGEVIAEAFNSQTADNVAVNHAEIKAIIAANKNAGSRKLASAVAYCSCEPCAMCLTALSYANVGRIVYHKSMQDLFPADPQSTLNAAEYVKGLNFVPVLEQLSL